MLAPVFRRATFGAELRRQTSPTHQAKVVFVDEGNQCRSILAESIFRNMLEHSTLCDAVAVESASLGPCFGDAYDDAVVTIAKVGTSLLVPANSDSLQAAHLTLPPRTCRVFDECTDIVDADLVLVMDAFDYAALLREVSVFDAINPRGRYSQRVKHVGGFAPIAPTALRPVEATPNNASPDPPRHTTEACQSAPDAADHAVLHPRDIPDPLYGDGRVDPSALRAMVQALRRACRGVLAYLETASRQADDLPDLSSAIASSVAATDAAPLACPVRLGGHVHPHPTGGLHRHPVKWRPLWLDDADLVIEQQRLLRGAYGATTAAEKGTPTKRAGEQAVYTLGNNGGVIVPLHGLPRRRGYWCELHNVLYELVEWMRAHEYGSGYMPAATELKDTGAHQLAHAIMHHGGTHEVGAVCNTCMLGICVHMYRERWITEYHHVYCRLRGCWA